jgi:LemA protein
MNTLLAIGLPLGVLLLAAVWVYNRLVYRRNLVAEAWAGIDVQLQKRHELVPNLVATVRGYIDHESRALEKVTRLRSAATDDVTGRAQQESSLSRSLGRLFALAENYPELKAAEGFRQLHGSLVEVEDHLQYARRYYNGAVRDLNNLVESFPSNLMARVFGFRTAPFFEIEFASQRDAPGVGF